MGVQIATLFHKDMPFDELIEKIVATFKDIEIPPEGFKVPYPFWTKILETRSLTVIHYAVQDLLVAYEKADDLHLELQSSETAALKKVINTNKLDEIYLICHEKLEQGDSEQAQALRDFLSIGSNRFRKHVFGDSRQEDNVERRPMTQADLSRIHMTDYVDDGWRREAGPNGPTDFMIRKKQ